MANPPQSDAPDAELPAGLVIPEDSGPSQAARVLAFVSVLVGGLCGGLIGFAVVDLSCDEGCTVWAGLVGVLSALVAATGTAVVAVLALRSSAEWRQAGTRRPA